MKKNRGRLVFLEELAARNLSKVSLHFNKIPNFLRQVLQAYSEICIFCVLKNCPPEAVNFQCDEIHTIANLGQKFEGYLGY